MCWCHWRRSVCFSRSSYNVWSQPILKLKIYLNLIGISRFSYNVWSQPAAGWGRSRLGRGGCHHHHLHHSHYHFHDRHLQLRVLVILIILTTVVFITVLEYYRDPRKHLLVTVDMTTSRIFNLTIPVSAGIIIIKIIDITSYRDEQQHLYVYLTRIRFFISIVYSTFLFFFLFS